MNKLLNKVAHITLDGDAIPDGAMAFDSMRNMSIAELDQQLPRRLFELREDSEDEEITMEDMRVGLDVVIMMLDKVTRLKNARKNTILVLGSEHTLLTLNNWLFDITREYTAHDHVITDEERKEMRMVREAISTLRAKRGKQ